MFKYNEDKNLVRVLDYIQSTYSEHYTADKSDIQTLDIWDHLGSADTTCRDNAIKYLTRYGKKQGFKKEDLLKTIHFAVLLLHFHEKYKEN